MSKNTHTSGIEISDSLKNSFKKIKDNYILAAIEADKTMSDNKKHYYIIPQSHTVIVIFKGQVVDDYVYALVSTLYDKIKDNDDKIGLSADSSLQNIFSITYVKDLNKLEINTVFEL